MDYVDKILVQLANAQTRAQLFDETGLEQLVTAAYQTELLNLQGPYAPDFTKVQIGYAVPTVATFEGVWNKSGGTDRTEAQFRVVGLGNPIRVDALWQGGIVAKSISADSHIIAVTTELTDVEQDVATEKVRVTFAEPNGGIPAMQRYLPITAAIFIRADGFSLAQLLTDSKYVREQLEPLGMEALNDAGLPRRVPILIMWIVPATIFDDASWPGADATARRRAAANWLAQEGIGLVTTPNG